MLLGRFGFFATLFFYGLISFFSFLSRARSPFVDDNFL